MLLKLSGNSVSQRSSQVKSIFYKSFRNEIIIIGVLIKKLPTHLIEPNCNDFSSRGKSLTKEKFSGLTPRKQKIRVIENQKETNIMRGSAIIVNALFLV